MEFRAVITRPQRGKIINTSKNKPFHPSTRHAPVFGLNPVHNEGILTGEYHRPTL